MMKRRYLATVSLALLALLVFAMPVGAGVSWCRADPIVKLNGTDVQILIAVPEEYVHLVNGPLETKIILPANVSREVIFLDAGFNGYGETVTFANQGTTTSNPFEIRVQVKVPMDTKSLPSGTQVPVELTIIPSNAQPMVFIGNNIQANAWVSIVGTT